MINVQEVKTRIIHFIHNGYKIELAKTHGTQLTILIYFLLFFIHPNSTKIFLYIYPNSTCCKPF